MKFLLRAKRSLRVKQLARAYEQAKTNPSYDKRVGASIQIGWLKDEIDLIDLCLKRLVPQLPPSHPVYRENRNH